MSHIQQSESVRPQVVLVNGLAEQGPTWSRNVDVWRRHFNLHLPTLADYRSDSLHSRIAKRLPIDVPYLVSRLEDSLSRLVNERCHLVANSMGGKIAVRFALRHPERVRSVVLIGSAGLGGMERLPIVEGVRRSDPRGVVASVFGDATLMDEELVRYHRDRFQDRRWRLGLLRTVRGTLGQGVRHLLPELTVPVLLVVGMKDRIIDPHGAISAVKLLSQGYLDVLDHCGHAPQIEDADHMNRRVVEFIYAEYRNTRTVSPGAKPSLSRGTNTKPSARVVELRIDAPLTANGST
jgi:pimeloyl-ACP methyl ester carboxylesterase